MLLAHLHHNLLQSYIPFVICVLHWFRLVGRGGWFTIVVLFAMFESSQGLAFFYVIIACIGCVKWFFQMLYVMTYHNLSKVAILVLGSANLNVIDHLNSTVSIVDASLGLKIFMCF